MNILENLPLLGAGVCISFLYSDIRNMEFVGSGFPFL